MAVPQAPLRTQSIQYVKGVGPRRVTQLRQLGLTNLEDACYFPPRRYEDRTRLVAIRDLAPGEPNTVRGTIVTTGLRRIHRGQTIFEAAIEDPSGVLHGIWFNQPYLAQQLKAGEELILYGKLEPGGRPQMVHPEIERVDPEEHGSIHMGRIVPIYPLTSGVGQRWLRQVIAEVVERVSGALQDPLPRRLLDGRGWPALPEAVRELHFPTSMQAMEAARERLAFEELLLLQLGLAQRRARTVAQIKPQRYRLDGPLTQALHRRMPFQLTADQQRVLGELLADLSEPSPMHRLLQGDVGCGKTIVMVLLMAGAVENGHQVVLMAPTELLAEQHARTIQGLLGPLRVSAALLSQGVVAAERRPIVEGIADGTISIVIGTHALLQKDVAFKRLALVVIDEQHKFGVTQRSALARKARMADVLVVTATPIPRTLALTIYGDLEISTINQLPPGRAPIKTLWMHEVERSDLYGLLREELRQGRQGYVVYPLVEPIRLRSGFDPERSRGIEEQATQEVRAATQMAKQLQQEVFPEFKIGLLHGQMKPKQKEQVMHAFAGGELSLLVSTVIVEVGLDVPNATAMVIEHPERFGLAQLHQLRGRIGRSNLPATCVVVSDSDDEAVRERLSAFVRTTDGFQLAEKDLELRGPGELRGSRQHGVVRFRIADLIRDRALLEDARQEAAGVVGHDPDLKDPALAVLRDRLARFQEQS